jgi:hypothetical protein
MQLLAPVGPAKAKIDQECVEAKIAFVERVIWHWFSSGGGRAQRAGKIRLMLMSSEYEKNEDEIHTLMEKEHMHTDGVGAIALMSPCIRK